MIGNLRGTQKVAGKSPFALDARQADSRVQSSKGCVIRWCGCLGAKLGEQWSGERLALGSREISQSYRVGKPQVFCPAAESLVSSRSQKHMTPLFPKLGSETTTRGLHIPCWLHRTRLSLRQALSAQGDFRATPACPPISQSAKNRPNPRPITIGLINGVS